MPLWFIFFLSISSGFEACVNCVRWSHNGKFLASGGDDKLVMIWQTSRGAGPSKAFGSSGSVVIYEQWRPVFTLRGHTGGNYHFFFKFLKYILDFGNLCILPY